LKYAAGGVNGAIDRNAVALADDEIFLTVAGGGVDSAGTLFKGDVISDKAERIAIKKRVTKDDAI
jgi:hypothetical protein